MKEVKDKNIIVTGGSRGIGLVVARAFAEAGARVCIIARDKEEIKKAILGLRKTQKNAHGFACDISQKGGVAKITRHVRTAFRGRVDVLVNAAGIYGPKGRLEENDLALWEKTFAVNVLGTALACRAVIPFMRKRKTGRIITFSGGGEGAFPYFTAYSASKGAIVRFTESLAAELAKDNITVNAVAPGAVNTALLDEVLSAGPQKVGASFYARSREQKESGGVLPEKAAALILFLASDAAGYLSGKVMSAVHDKWGEFGRYKNKLISSDIYNVRRIKPKDRGYDW